jgi:hypothetical protein
VSHWRVDRAIADARAGAVRGSPRDVGYTSAMFSNRSRSTAPRMVSLSNTIVMLVLLLGVARTGSNIDASQPDVVHQLRIYEIFEGNKQVFHQRFREHAMRIMARYDFKILSMWETTHAGRTEFAYLLEWPSEAVMKDRWVRFLADKEWGDIKQATRIHGALVGEIQDRTLIMVDHSPRALVKTP